MKKIKGNTYFHESGACQGGYQVDGHWLIIDSGSNASNAKKSVKDLKDESIDYVFNTHFHADHCGGNQYFQNKQGAKIIAPALESSFIQSPLLEPVYLYGAYPPKELQNRFLMAKESRVDLVQTGQHLEISLGGQTVPFQTLSLKGHSPNMLGLVTPDRIAFLGDALIGETIVEKHPLLFTYNIKDHLDTLDRIASFDYDGYVLSHGGYYDSIDKVIEINRQAMLEVSQSIEAFVSSASASIEDLHQMIADKYRLEEKLTTYVLNHSVIKAHVQYLIDSARIQPVIYQGKLMITAR